MPIEVKVVEQAEYDEWRRMNLAAGAAGAARSETS